MMVVLAVIILVVSMAAPVLLRARRHSQATQILSQLQLLQSALDQYALAAHSPAGTLVEWKDLQPYLKRDPDLYLSRGTDPLGNRYGNGHFAVGQPPKLSSSSFATLSDVAPEEAWSPFYP